MNDLFRKEETIKEILMRRDNLTSKEADDIIEEALVDLEDLLNGDGDYYDAEEIVSAHFGLEPDYLMELICMSEKKGLRRDRG